jgi:hypothetical protein
VVCDGDTSPESSTNAASLLPGGELGERSSLVLENGESCGNSQIIWLQIHRSKTSAHFSFPVGTLNALKTAGDLQDAINSILSFPSICNERSSQKILKRLGSPSTPVSVINSGFSSQIMARDESWLFSQHCNDPENADQFTVFISKSGPSTPICDLSSSGTVVNCSRQIDGNGSNDNSTKNSGSREVGYDGIANFRGVESAVLYLTLKNVSTDRSARFLVPKSRISSAQNIGDLLACINKAVGLSINKLSVSLLFQDEKADVAIMHPGSAGYVKSSCDEPWSIDDYSGTNMEILVAESKHVCCKFEQVSAWAKGFYANDSFYDNLLKADSLDTFFNFPEAQAKVHQQECVDLLQRGSNSLIPALPIYTLSSREADESVPEGFWGIGFLDVISWENLGVGPDFVDSLTQGSKFSTLQLLLHELLKMREEGACSLSMKLEGSDLATINDAGHQVPKRLLFRCNCTKDCNHFGRYITGDFKAGNNSISCFTLASRSKTSLGHGYHNCNKANAAKCFGCIAKGKNSWEPWQLKVARLLLWTRAKFDLVLQALGVDSKDLLFKAKEKSLRDKLKLTLRSERVHELENLEQYLRGELKSGRLAFVSVESVPKRADLDRRILWIRTKQMIYSKLGLVLVLSFDFLNDMISPRSSVFGHLSIRTPSGCLSIVGQFIIESENRDAIEWVFQKFELAHDEMGICRPKPVEIFCTFKIFFSFDGIQKSFFLSSLDFSMMTTQLTKHLSGFLRYALITLD